ncbi:uncharacterized protein LOC144703041 [Wolffia australiana]
MAGNARTRQGRTWPATVFSLHSCSRIYFVRPFQPLLLSLSLYLSRSPFVERAPVGAGSFSSVFGEMGVAAAFGGFSIREFTALIRSRDVENCWPFGGDVQADALPPIECAKHRWWSDELERTAGSAAENEKEEVCRVEDMDSNGLQDSQSAKPGSPKIPKAKTQKTKCVVELVAAAPIVDIRNECEEAGQEEGTVVGTSPRAEQEEGNGLDLSKKRKKKRNKEGMVKRTKKDSDVVMKKDEEKKQPGQKQRGTRMRNSTEVDTKEETKNKSTSLSTIDLPQAQGCPTVKGIRKDRKDKKSAGRARKKGENHTKVRRRRNLKNIEGSKLLSSPDHHNATDASIHLVRMQVTNPALTSSFKNGSIEETNQDGERENHMSMQRSRPLQSLCRVFSNVLAASKSMYKTSAQEINSAAKKMSYDKDQLVVPAQTSDDEDVLTRSERGSRSPRMTGFGEMVDLNDPIEICCNQVEPLKEIRTVQRTESDDTILEDCITPRGPSDFNADIIASAKSKTMEPVASNPPASAERISGHMGLGTSSKLFEAVEMRRVFSIDRDSYAHDYNEGTVNAMNQNTLTRDLLQSPTTTFLENGSSRDVLNGLPATSKGELIPGNTNRQGNSQEARMKKNPTPAPHNTLPEHNFIEKSSPYQPSWKAPEQWFLDRRQDSAGNNGQCTITQNAIGNPSKSFAFNSNPRNTSYAGENLSHAFLSSTSEPSTVRLMGTNVMIGRNSSNHPCSWKVKERFNESTAVAGSRPNGHEMFESYFYGGANEVSTSISPYAGAQFGSNLAMNAGAKNLLHRNDRQTASFTPDQFIPSETLARHHFSNEWPRQGHIFGNLASPNILFGERSSRNLHLSLGNFKSDDSRYYVSDKDRNTGNDLPSTSAYLTSKQLTQWSLKEVRERYSEADILRQLGTQGTTFSNFLPIDDARLVRSSVNPAKPLERPQIAEKLATVQAFSVNDPGKVASLSGPVKLSAGARHVLKRGWRVADKDKPLGAQPTFPFSPEGSSRNVPVREEKSTKIHKL